MRSIIWTLILLSLTSGTARAELPDWALQADELGFVTANAEFTLLHEMGHLLIHELQLPVLGREEDAADQLGLVGLFLLHDEHEREGFQQKLLDIADYWHLQSLHASQMDESIQAWDSHSLDEQRFYNIACLAYGSAPEQMEWVLTVTGLPYERAFYCDQEYQQVVHAVNWLTRHFTATDHAAHHKISVHYGEPPVQLMDGHELRERIRQSGILESVAERASTRFALHRPVQLQLASCGAADAWYNHLHAELTLCYELIEHYRQLFGQLADLRQQRTASHP